MFDARNYYDLENQKIWNNYIDTTYRIKAIYEETLEDGEMVTKPIDQFFHHTAKWILRLVGIEEKLKQDYFETTSFEDLKALNHELYEELIPENYKRSYANPSYAVERFGEKSGKLLSAFYTTYRNYIDHAFRHKVFQMEKYNRLFIEAYHHIKAYGLDYDGLRDLMTKYVTMDLEQELVFDAKEKYDPDYRFLTDIAVESNLEDLSYLFKYGVYVSDHEINMAKFLSKYPEEKIKALSKTIAEAYIQGFKKDNKDIKKRTTVMIIGVVGQERIFKTLIKAFEEAGLKPIVAIVETTAANKQYAYDHKFDQGIYLDRDYVDLKLEIYKKGIERLDGILKKVAGPMVFESFGEAPFSPEDKPERIKLTDLQSELSKKLQSHTYAIRQQYVPRSETSFSIVAFPSPQIGEDFEAIFEDIVRVNSLDNGIYEQVQQAIVDVLDGGDYVHVKGKSTNETDIKVKLHTLENPAKETNFVNCVADVNIPLGEVYTTPVLKGSNGVLHIEEVYLDELNYKNLKLTFEDGYVTDYTCSNFEKEEANRNYIKENLLFPHDSLPLGEFAIGTNTLAYVIAEKYGIIDKLPILIVEKMGPHFAIGDTCFSWEEDHAVYNRLDGKEIIARDNEKSLLRKTNKDEAYTQCHTDITLPYDGLEFIKVIKGTGEEEDIIRDGRFVTPGTDLLNEPFEER